MTELTTDQIRTLDRERTVVLLPGGILEEHGPYLPSFTDGYQNEHYTRQLADAIASRPGWTALVFPTIPLGSGGANQIGGKYAFPGTYAVRPATVRAVFMDLADALGEQGFTWVFIVHGHGSPDHNRSLHEAGEYFRQTYGGRMVHLLGLGGKQQPGRPIQQQPQHVLADSLPSEALAEEGLGVHAGVVEHSRLLALRPELVPPEVRKATPVTARNRADLRRLASMPGWLGYFGTPARATAELGHELLKDVAQQLIETAMWILDGGDERGRRLFLDVNPVADADPVMGPARRHEAARERRQQEWLARRMPSAVMTAQEDRGPTREDHRQALEGEAEAQDRDVSKPFYLHDSDLEWTRHEINDGWVEIAFLYTDPETRAQKLLIRHSLGAHVPKHWHSANETHVCLSGALTLKDETGGRATLRPGEFAYTPAKVVHEAWASREETTVTLVTVDGAFDVNWVEPPRQAGRQERP